MSTVNTYLEVSLILSYDNLYLLLAQLTVEKELQSHFKAFRNVSRKLSHLLCCTLKPQWVL